MSTDVQQTSLMTLPPEILLLIGSYIRTRGLNRLSRASKRLHQVFNPILYESFAIKLSSVHIEYVSPTASDDIVDQWTSSYTQKLLRSLSTNNKHLKRLRIQTTFGDPMTRNLLQSSISRALRGRDVPLEKCQIDMEYGFHQITGNGNYKVPQFALQPLSAFRSHRYYWLDTETLTGFHAKQFILTTTERYNACKGTFIAVQAETQESGYFKTENDLTKYLNQSRKPIIMGYLPENPKRPLEEWEEGDDGEEGSIEWHEKGAFTCIKTYLKNRCHSTESIKELDASRVPPITFVGSATRDEGHSAELGQTIRDRMTEEGLGHLTGQLKFEEWTDHLDLAKTLGVE